jgi:hypothetical protein
MALLTEEQKIQYKEFKETDEYKSYMEQIVELKAPLTEEILEPIVWEWYCRERMGIVFDELEPFKKIKSNEPTFEVFESQEEYYKANPHIKEQVDAMDEVERQKVEFKLNGDIDIGDIDNIISQ